MERALALLDPLDRVVVALSGGVDSAVLGALALRALDPSRVCAVTARSAAVPEREVAIAARLAQEIGLPHRFIDTDELTDPDYRANRGDRCYHCRKELFTKLDPIRTAFGEGGTIVYGAIADDLSDDRPGMRAAEEAGIRAPLLEAGMTKADVREVARELQLSVSEKPAAACLSSRLPAGTEVTPDRLRRIERAEASLFELGFVQFRVRDHGDVARLEFDPEGLKRVQSAPLNRQVVEAVRAAGFRYVSVDLEGFRSGSLNLLSD